MPAPEPLPERVPERVRARFDAIVALTTEFAGAHLDAEYAALCRRMAAELARPWRSPLERGTARTWAAGIVYAVGWVNFLTDPSQVPHMTTAELAQHLGVGQSTLAAQFRTIRAMFGLHRLDPEWTRPSHLLENPIAWIVLVDGIPVDLRTAPREIQEEAFRAGVIPFLPNEAAGDDETLGDEPSASIDVLNAALATTAGGYNRRAQTELGGLSPNAVQRLLDAGWAGPDSAIRLAETLPLDALDAAPMLHDARLVLDMLAERGEVRATPKGNLPRAFVAEYRERARAVDAPRGVWDSGDWHAPGHAPDADAAPAGGTTPGRARNEEDVLPLHHARVLLDLAGLLKRRRGSFSRTRRGAQLGAPERAGELFATLVRTHFRRFNLAYLDGVGPAPGFQYTVGYTLYQFGRTGAEWRRAKELTGAAVLPFVRDELASRPFNDAFDALALLLETRFLRPLYGFGLAEARLGSRAPGDWTDPVLYRKAPLFDRLFAFDLAGGDPSVEALPGAPRTATRPPRRSRRSR